MSGNDVRFCYLGDGRITAQWIVNKTITSTEMTVVLTASRFHDRPHLDMAKQLARQTQGFHGSLRPQFLGGVCFGCPGVLTRGEVYGQAR